MQHKRIVAALLSLGPELRAHEVWSTGCAWLQALRADLDIFILIFGGQNINVHFLYFPFPPPSITVSNILLT